jgi:hypothetical protein
LSASSFEDTSVFIDHRYVIAHTGALGRLKKKKRVRSDTKCRFTDRHRKEIGTECIWNTPEITRAGYFTKTQIHQDIVGGLVDFFRARRARARSWHARACS